MNGETQHPPGYPFLCTAVPIEENACSIVVRLRERHGYTACSLPGALQKNHGILLSSWHCAFQLGTPAHVSMRMRTQVDFSLSYIIVCRSSFLSWLHQPGEATHVPSSPKIGNDFAHYWVVFLFPFWRAFQYTRSKSCGASVDPFPVFPSFSNDHSIRKNYMTSSLWKVDTT
ncbi:hypothetical protein Krac_2719 [Ktedonobacter racemifer DSM 44963]|uniref:Uncharacterized protein n=1 Tax=Ktedonobacter racemifer DSM 44963 TaxID=485913 RepID=D6TZG5_KTERA|nr:hypothetical protein Krac_2719 [Ktedonobacter racemifer DSM 44963]